MNDRLKHFYMAIAHQSALLSRAQRLQVGSVIVKDNNIISFSWNGTPRGWDNTCEYKEYMPPLSKLTSQSEIDNEWPFEDEHGRYCLKTKPEVLHAERNALDKLARSNQSGDGATIFITHAPCIECAKSIYGAGITEVYYANEYRSRDGIEFLEKCNIPISHLPFNSSKESK